MRMIKSLIYTAIFNYFIIKRRRKKIIKKIIIHDCEVIGLHCLTVSIVYSILLISLMKIICIKKSHLCKNLRYICFVNDKLFKKSIRIFTRIEFADFVCLFFVICM